MRTLLVLVVVVLGPALAHAQTPCAPPTFTADEANAIPNGFTAADKATLIGSTRNVLGPVPIDAAAGKFTVTSAVLLTNVVTVRWEKTDGTSCTQRLAEDSPARATSGQSFMTSCVAAGAQAEAELRKLYNGRENYVVIVLSELGVCYASKHFSTEGDALYIGYAREDATAATIEFDKCDAASAIPKILASDISGISPTAGRAPKFSVQWFVPVPQCFGTSVEFHLNKSGANKFVSTQLTQYERYRATLQVGAVFTTRHIESFGLKPQNGTNVLVSNGPGTDTAPEYIASVVIYGVPNYFMRRRISEPSFLPGAAVASPRKVPYFGREPVHETGVRDRVGAMIGVGLSQPGRRFVAGLTFELVMGVNAFVAGEYAKLTFLNGFEPGQEFSGAADTIPLRDEWQKGWVVGLSFDGRYATALFGKK